ncbi:MAG: phosphoribosylformylglycinamidine synthase subunit PurL [Candidatus Levybacteria bacterium]|nr:phosphoribosylformylglycinamidine synthase subunit PurL [Candidatus Levybacteria bacterium]
MVHTIRVQTTKGPDIQGEALLHEIKQLEKTSIKKVTSIKVYRVEGVTKSEAKKLAELAFSESVNQEFTIDKSRHSTLSSSRKRGSSILGQAENDKQYTIEIAYKPGVMNPEVGSILKSAEDLGIKLTAADSSKEYIFSGTISKNELSKLIETLNLYNPLIEHIVSKDPRTLLIEGKVGKTNIIPLREATDNELMRLSKDKLFLNLEEMKVIQRYFQSTKRDPTDCELEVLAQTWSEHCVHKTFRADLTIDGKKKPSLISRIKETAKGHPSIVSAFVDNSGVIDFYDGYGICGKVETHNSPSAIEPYGGAMTGSGGVFRDVLGTGQGAKPLISTDIFCFAPPDLPKKLLPPGCLPPDYILKRVVQGVRDYGNRVGIPTNNGSLHFYKDFRAKPTVAVGAYGIIPKKQAIKKSPNVGDLALTLGGRTGRDGIHGATFSSGEMTHQTKTVSETAVQIGNAIEEKRVIDAIQELREEGLIHATTDCGAGGYSSAVGEMGKDAGVSVHLENVPLKYAGLAPWEIFLSESQERMVIAIDPKMKKRVLAICKKYNVEAAAIATFDGSKRLHVYFQKEKICDLSMDFLHDGLPRRHMVGISKKRVPQPPLPPADLSSEALAKEEALAKAGQLPKDLERSWKKVLSDPNVCSKEPIVRLYDHTVQGRNALPPFAGVAMDAPTDGAIVKPFYDKPYGLVTTHGLNPVLNTFDPFWGSVWAITEAVANYVSVGGNLKDAALIDNFIWPFPDEESLADLDKSVDACVAMAKLLKMPFVSGKDSLSSTYRYPDGKALKIPPVLLISVFGKIPDVAKTASSDFKKKDSVIVFVGQQDTKHLGGSVYLNDLNHFSGDIPRVNLKTLPKILSAITNGIQNHGILSCHDVSEGGIAVAVAEMCFGAGFGAEIDLKKISSGRPDYTLFNETAGTFLVEVADEKAAAKIFKNLPHETIGKTTRNGEISVLLGKKQMAKASINELKTAWQKTMREYFG